MILTHAFALLASIALAAVVCETSDGSPNTGDCYAAADALTALGNQNCCQSTTSCTQMMQRGNCRDDQRATWSRLSPKILLDSLENDLEAVIWILHLEDLNASISVQRELVELLPGVELNVPRNEYREGHWIHGLDSRSGAPGRSRTGDREAAVGWCVQLAALTEVRAIEKWWDSGTGKKRHVFVKVAIQRKRQTERPFWASGRRWTFSAENEKRIQYYGATRRAAEVVQQLECLLERLTMCPELTCGKATQSVIVIHACSVTFCPSETFNGKGMAREQHPGNCLAMLAILDMKRGFDSLPGQDSGRELASASATRDSGVSAHSLRLEGLSNGGLDISKQLE
ncbi:hypothetical protein AURDEDRAFT_127749 [Auricularia subglabra TFB-10046 SS5]|nr:hypothetical protein AURDEDRAFT_127749 [Auricularia subglabra TFB-10046 SS5]